MSTVVLGERTHIKRVSNYLLSVAFTSQG